MDVMYKIFFGVALLVGIFASIAFGDFVTKGIPEPKRKWWQRFWVLFAMAALFAGALSIEHDTKLRLLENPEEIKQAYEELYGQEGK